MRTSNIVNNQIKLIKSVLGPPAMIIVILLGVVGCVSQKKYEALLNDHDEALDQIAKLKVSRSITDYDQASDTYEMTGSIYSQMKENADQLDSLRKLVALQNDGLMKVRKTMEQLDYLQWKVDEVDRNITLDLDHEIYFDAGENNLSEKGKNVVAQIAGTIKNLDLPVNVWVVGHTDSQPMKGSKDNWDLSTERSLAVVRALIASGIAPSAITASARSKFDPQSVNAIDPGRSLNRRTEILIVPQQVFKNEISTILSEIKKM